MRLSCYRLSVYDTEGRLFNVKYFFCSKEQAMIYCDDLLTNVFSSSDHAPYLVEIRVLSNTKHYRNRLRLVGYFRRSCDGLQEVKIHG